MKFVIACLISVITLISIAGCTVGNKYLSPNSGDISYIDVVAFKNELITGKRVTADYMLGIIDEKGCVSGRALKNIGIESLDDNRKIGVPANREIALITGQSIGRQSCLVAVAARFEKEANYQWNFLMDNTSCQIKVSKENGNSAPVKLDIMTDRLVSFCKIK